MIAEYFESKTSVLSVAVRLQYARKWKRYVHDYLTEAFQGKDIIKLELFTDGGKRKPKMFRYNLWYVDSYKAFW